MAKMVVADLLGVPSIDPNALLAWAFAHVPRIVILLGLAYAAQKIIKRVLPRTLQAAISRGGCAEGPAELVKRCDTLAHVGVKTAVGAVWVVIGFMLLSEIEVDIAPILAGVGVVGIAIGFGAQALVRDVISGIFVLIENQYSRGDVVKVAGVTGLVESINLRRTVLRDLDGTVHHVPNGEIKVASNLTREWSRVNVNVQVSYDSDLDRVIEVINRVGQELAEDPAYGPLIVEAPKVLRVESFGESGIDIKILGVTQPIKQWEVAGELRRRLKRTFDQEGIEIPFPHRVLITRDAGSKRHDASSSDEETGAEAESDNK